jgi:adiponectin receptor
VYFTVAKAYTKPEFRLFRTFLFIALGLSAILPLIHGGVVYGLTFIRHAFSLVWLVVMAALYIGGALLYAYRIPERFTPGTFDLWGHSHQLFHLLVIAGALVHWAGVLNAYTFWLARGAALSSKEALCRLSPEALVALGPSSPL